MRLIPFDRTFAKQIYDWNLDQTSRRFWRGINRYLTFEECERLPEITGLEVLMILSDEDKVVGMVEFTNQGRESRFTILIDRNLRRDGYGTIALLLALDYAFNIKQVDYLFTECSSQDSSVIKALKEANFTQIGVIENYINNLRNIEDAILFYKRRG